MKALIELMAKSLVDNPEEVVVAEIGGEKTALFELRVATSDIGKVVGKVSCPSGSFLLLPVREDIPMPLGALMGEAFKNGTGVQIKIPNGTYRVFYEQFEVPDGSKPEFFQNIVVQKQ